MGRKFPNERIKEAWSCFNILRFLHECRSEEEGKSGRVRLRAENGFR